jgi:RNA polymerase sigma factor (sigma-70 family)
LYNSLETDIWTLVSSGDQDAYARLYVFYYKRLYNYGRKFTDDLIALEDALQEALLAIWTGRQRLPQVDKPHSYLLTTFRYILFKKLRRDHKVVRLSSVEAAETGEPEFGIDQLLIRRDIESALRHRLQQALQTLTSRQREAIFLRFYEGLSYEEVAAIMGISVKATYKLMSRSLLQLKETLSLPVLTILLLLRGLI